MANTTVYPFGQGGQLPASVGIVNDLWTGGADKAGSAEMIKKLNGEICVLDTKDLSSLTKVQAVISSSDNEWVTNNSSYKCVFLPVLPGQTYLIKATSSRNVSVAVLINTNHTSGATPNYATGWTERVRVTTGSYYETTIPSDGHYMYILVLDNGNDATPEITAVVKNRFDSVQKEIDIINTQRMSTDGINVMGGWYISSDNKWYKQSNTPYTMASILVPVTPGNDYVLMGMTSGGLFAVLTSSSKSDATAAPMSTAYPSRFKVEAGDVFEFTAPNDAAFVYVCVLSSGNPYDAYVAVPKTIDQQFQEISTGTAGSSEFELDAVANIADAIGNELYTINPVVDEDGYVVAETIQELDVVKKAQQMANIKWTPLVNMPYAPSENNTNGYFPAGTQKTGIVYSSVKELDKYVGKDVSIHTFMTAVNNPYSLIYTENVSGDNSQSAWGKTYHGINCATYYGNVCSQFFALCSGCPIDYATAFYPWLAKSYHKVVKVFDQSAQGAKRGDLLWTSGHCRLVYGVKKDSNGIVTHVRIAESIHPTTVINAVKTASWFNGELSNGAVIFRPLWLYKNFNYVPSPYVAVGDETPQTVVYNDDICCFAGDKATFREGDTIAVNYNLKQVGAWTAMELYKGSTLLDTITIDTSEHAVDLTSRNLTYGKYKARMTDGVNYSDYTEWEILQADVTATNADGITTVTVTSANGQHIAIKVCDITGSAKCMLELTDDQQNASSFDINLVELNAGQYPTKPIRGTSGLYLKVYFQGEFGRVTNEPLSIYFD